MSQAGGRRSIPTSILVLSASKLHVRSEWQTIRDQIRVILKSGFCNLLTIKRCVSNLEINKEITEQYLLLCSIFFSLCRAEKKHSEARRLLFHPVGGRVCAIRRCTDALQRSDVILKARYAEEMTRIATQRISRQIRQGDGTPRRSPPPQPRVFVGL